MGHRVGGEPEASDHVGFRGCPPPCGRVTVTAHDYVGSQIQIRIYVSVFVESTVGS